VLPQLRSYLLDNRDNLLLGGLQPRSVDFLVQATGVSKLCCYVFIDNEPQPRWVAKMMRSRVDNEILAREYGIIRYLRDHGSDFVRATVPGPLFTTYIAEHLVGIESYLRGQPMDGLLRHTGMWMDGDVRDYLDLAIDWLLRSQQETASQYGPLGEDELRAHFIMPIIQLRELARLTTAEQNYLDRLVERLPALAEYPLALRFIHGDFQPGNILLTGSSIHVIDWEFGNLTGLPLMDVFSFVARAYARCRGLEEIDGELEDYIAAFEAVFFEGGSFAELTAEYVMRVCQALKIHPAWLRVLFPLFLVLESIKYHTFLKKRANRGYIYLLRGNHADSAQSYVDQLDRQKNVLLLAHLMRHEERSIFNHLD
jgi:hypothetical protein